MTQLLDPLVAMDPGKLYREIAYTRGLPPPGWIRDAYDIVAYPGEPPRDRPYAGDHLVRIPLGEPGTGKVLVLQDALLKPRRSFERSGIRCEPGGKGWYARVVVDDNALARRVLDQDGRMPLDQVLVRPKRSMAVQPDADLSPPEAAEEDPPVQNGDQPADHTVLVGRLAAETGLHPAFIEKFLKEYDEATRPRQRFPGVIDPRGVPVIQLGAPLVALANPVLELVEPMLELVPGVGIFEGVTGRSILGDRKMAAWERMLSIVLDLLPLAGRALRLPLKAVTQAGREVARAAVHAADWATAAVRLRVRPAAMLRFIGRIGRLPADRIRALRAQFGKVLEQKAKGVMLDAEEHQLLKEIAESAEELRPAEKVKAPSGGGTRAPEPGPTIREPIGPPELVPAAALARIAGRVNTAEKIFDVLRNREVFWTSKSGKFRVEITEAGQLVGTHSSLKAFRRSFKVEGEFIYKGWPSHHIVEQVHLNNLGIRRYFPPYDELPCVLLPNTSHAERLGSFLRAADKKIGLTSAELYGEYAKAYRMLDDYTRIGSAEEIAAELLRIVKRMLGFI